MKNMHRQAWISDTSNKKVKQVKQSFQMNLLEQTKDSRINYYDFLLVAKKLAFRFEQSSHLMDLKNFFSKNKNSVLVKKLVDALAINQQSLNSKDDKMQIVKFNVPDNNFPPIKQVTNQDEEQFYEEGQNTDQQGHKLEKINSNPTSNENENSRQINQKIAVILSIKLEEMNKKLQAITDQFHYPNIFTVFDDHSDKIQYQEFKTGILVVISDIRDKTKMSEDDIKAIFHLLKGVQQGFIKLEDIEKLKNPQSLNQQMKQFYRLRINKNMVKNTLFKLGKVKDSSIQIYQLKNASILQFQHIQDSIVNGSIQNINMKKKIPHFGPLKAANILRKNNRHYNSTEIKYGNTLSKKGTQLNKQRQKIQKILKQSKEGKIRQKTGDTVTNKLRSLFIHKVILPRQKMLDEQKQKYGRVKTNQYQLAIRPMKGTQ